MLRNNGFSSDFHSDGRWNNTYHYEFQFTVRFVARNSTILKCESGLRNMRGDLQLDSNTTSIVEPNPALSEEHISTLNYFDSGLNAESGNTNLEIYRYSSSCYIIQGDYQLNGNYIPYLKTSLHIHTSSMQTKSIECNLLVKRYLE
jgi:hypothetical protein